MEQQRHSGTMDTCKVCTVLAASLPNIQASDALIETHFRAITDSSACITGVRIMNDTMAIDQHGTTYHGLGLHPRKTLLERLNRKHASKMFRDNSVTSVSSHVGYVIGDLWLTLYKVTNWEGNNNEK